jgi:hypothetical protein
MAFLLTLLLPWWPLSPWLSPAAAWFIFFNAVVSAIAVMSTSRGAGAGATPPSPRRRLCRSGSSMVLDRLRSLFIFPVEVEQLPIDESSSAAAASHCCWPEAEAASATERNSLAAAATAGETAAISSTAQPSASVAVATAVVHAPPAPPTEEEEGNAEKEQEHDESAISLDEAYALAHRHRTKPLASPPPSAAASATAALPTEHKKVVADWRRVPKAGEALEGKAELNARADLFIRQFREELKLQRLNSVLNHTHALGSPTAAL